MSGIPFSFLNTLMSGIKVTVVPEVRFCTSCCNCIILLSCVVSVCFISFTLLLFSTPSTTVLPSLMAFSLSCKSWISEFKRVAIPFGCSLELSSFIYGVDTNGDVGTPYWNFIEFTIFGSFLRRTLTCTCSDNALTTLIPTPCKPPLTLYPEFVSWLLNFPPACNTVKTVCNAETLVTGCILVGIPRPSSITVMEFFVSSRDGSSLWIVIATKVACPAKTSSTELSTTSHIKWCNPSGPVLPIYIPGRFRTGSSPSKTVICSALYSFWADDVEVMSPMVSTYWGCLMEVSEIVVELISPILLERARNDTALVLLLLVQGSCQNDLHKEYEHWGDEKTVKRCCCCSVTIADGWNANVMVTWLVDDTSNNKKNSEKQVKQCTKECMEDRRGGDDWIRFLSVWAAYLTVKRVILVIILPELNAWVQL